MKKNVLIFFMLNTLFLFSQEIKFVTATNGLIVRKKPNKKSQRIGKLSYCSGVNVINKTNIKLSIKDDGELINGKWVEVAEINGNQRGFVFDGFLNSNTPNKGNETDGYYITKIDSITQKKYWKDLSIDRKPDSLFISLRNRNNHKNLVTFPISELEFYEGTTLKVNHIKTLQNIFKLVRVVLTYGACCSSTYEYFYLVGKNNRLIELPKIENSHCDGPEPYFDYIFPNDFKGEKGKIIYAELYPDLNGKIKKVDVIKRFSWNGSSITPN